MFNPGRGASVICRSHGDPSMVKARVGPARKWMLPSQFMPTDQIVAMLIAERDKLNAAIAALQGTTKRRGRPPKNPLAAPSAVAPPAPARKTRHFSAAQRAAAAERMRKRWAAKRKAEAKPKKASKEE